MKRVRHADDPPLDKSNQRGQLRAHSHRSDHHIADALRRGLDVLVRQVRISQGHLHVGVAEQSRDDRHRHP